jgi:catechol 2,3-dioxygenase-like lactoylglutathione lyase family enzyme
MQTLARCAAFVLALIASAAELDAQSQTALYDHVHMSVPNPQAAAQWYHDHIGGEFIDGRDDRLLFGTTRIMFLGGGESRRPSAGSVIDHLGFSFSDLAAKVAEVEAAGATVTTPLREVEGLFELAYINDPFGTRIELVEDAQHLGFHHVHLRSPEPEASLAWYEEHFGGVRLRMRGRIEGLLYPGNVWLLVTRGEAFPSNEGTIDHIGWRAPTADVMAQELVAGGVELTSQARDLQLPNGMIRFFYVAGPDGARVELVQRQADMR